MAFPFLYVECAGTFNKVLPARYFHVALTCYFITFIRDCQALCNARKYPNARFIKKHELVSAALTVKNLFRLSLAASNTEPEAFYPAYGRLELFDSLYRKAFDVLY